MIGFFDSGIGGFTILNEVRKLYPDAKFIYLADNLNCPYGEKSVEEIYLLTLRGLEFLIKKGSTLIILACNTATAASIKKIQNEWLPFSFPNIKVLGVIRPIPESLLENKLSTTKLVSILATPATIKTKFYDLELADFGYKKVLNIPAPGLAIAIENQQLLEIKLIVQNLLQTNSKTFSKEAILVLACTHYPIVKELILSQFNTLFPASNLQILDQASLTAKKLKDYLNNHLEIKLFVGELEIYCTENPKLFQNKIEKIFKID